MSRKAAYISALILALGLAPSPALAQKACVVLSSTAQPFKDAMRGFRSQFRGASEELVMPSEPAQAGRLIGEIAQRGCGVVSPMGSAALKFLRLRITDKPLVFGMTLSPAVRGSERLNVTGVYLEPSPGMQLSAVRRLLPAARRIGILYSAPSDYIQGLQREAAGMGMEIVSVSAPRVTDAIREISPLANRVDVLIMIPDVVTSAQDVFRSMLEVSIRSNVPIFALAEKHVQAGALAALVSDYAANGSQAASIAQRVAAGTPASSIKAEYTNKAGIVLNLKAAGRMGITVPASVMNEAVEVYR